MYNCLLLIFCLLWNPLAQAEEPFFTKEKISVQKEGTHWVSDWVEVNIPKGLVSFQILVIGSPETLVQVTDLIDPEGKEYLSSTSNPEKKIGDRDQPILRNVVNPNRSEAVSQGTGTLLVPNNPTLGTPKEGIWRLRTLSRFEPKRKNVSIYFFGKTKEPKNKIKARVWVAQNAWNNEFDLNDMLASAKKIYAEYGINLEFLSVEKITQSYFEPMDLPTQISQLAALKNNPDAINIYLMPEMKFQNKPVNGLACLGAPANINIKHSCFVSMYEALKGADKISVEEKGRILVHEIGHYLGLFHTRDESYYGIKYMTDPFNDTPETVTGTNMMDPGTHDKSPVFSPMQVKMMLTNPLLQ